MPTPDSWWLLVLLLNIGTPEAATKVFETKLSHEECFGKALEVLRIVANTNPEADHDVFCKRYDRIPAFSEIDYRARHQWPG